MLLTLTLAALLFPVSGGAETLDSFKNKVAKVEIGSSKKDVFRILGQADFVLRQESDKAKFTHKHPDFSMTAVDTRKIERHLYLRGDTCFAFDYDTKTDNLRGQFSMTSAKKFNQAVERHQQLQVKYPWCKIQGYRKIQGSGPTTVSINGEVDAALGKAIDAVKPQLGSGGEMKLVSEQTALQRLGKPMGTLEPGKPPRGPGGDLVNYLDEFLADSKVKRYLIYRTQENPQVLLVVPVTAKGVWPLEVGAPPGL